VGAVLEGHNKVDGFRILLEEIKSNPITVLDRP
jgi:hypothetical protein